MVSFFRSMRLSGINHRRHRSLGAKQQRIVGHDQAFAGQLGVEVHLRVLAVQQDFAGLGTSTSVSRVRVFGSTAPAVRTTLPQKLRPGNSLSSRHAFISARIEGA